jgi:hypothetical protein
VSKLGDAVGSIAGVLMFPHANDLPAERLEPPIRIGIPMPICFDLLAPPVGVGLRQSAVDRAAVPEATIHEHGNARRGKDDINATAPIR